MIAVTRSPSDPNGKESGLMSKVEKLKLCVGCTENFYNGNNGLGVKECFWTVDPKVTC